MKEVEFIVEILPEEAPVRGNACCTGDDDFDRQVEDEILADLAGGNDWAWCSVKVTARVDSIEGTAYSRYCNYTNKTAFFDDPHCAAMEEQALRELRDKLAGMRDSVERELGGR